VRRRERTERRLGIETLREGVAQQPTTHSLIL
jgi:hypothetical protein